MKIETAFHRNCPKALIEAIESDNFSGQVRVIVAKHLHVDLLGPVELYQLKCALACDSRPMCAVELTINLNGKDMSNIFLGELAAELQMLYVDVIQIHSLRDGRGYQMSLSVIDESVPATAKSRAFLGPIDVPVILEPELPLEHQEAHDPVGMPTGS
jgi:hypothetical protein